MAVKRSAPVQRIDPAVEAVVGDDPIYGRLARARRMTRGQRKKAERDRGRSKVTYDLPADLIQQIEEMAEKEGIPNSQMAMALIRVGEVQFKRGNVVFGKEPSKSPRFDWNLKTLGFKNNEPIPEIFF